jgi:hypothetical protein
MRRNGATGYIAFFLYLQVLDLLTTLVGFRFGLQEASPFIRTLMHFGPAAGVVVSKLVAVALAGVCVWLEKFRLLRVVCFWFAGLVTWNLCAMLAASPHLVAMR